MRRVTITGWRVGLSKIGLNHLIGQSTGCGLATAKRAVDDLVAGGTLNYDFSDAATSVEFLRLAEAIGAVCLISEESASDEQARSMTVP